MELRHLKRRSLADTAEMMGISPQAAAGLLRRGLETLRDRLSRARGLIGQGPWAMNDEGLPRSDEAGKIATIGSTRRSRRIFRRATKAVRSTGVQCWPRSRISPMS